MESKQTAMCPQCKEAVDRAETCIREHPMEAALTSLGMGFVLAHLPLRLLGSVLLSTVLLLLKPAMILYGIYRLAEDIHTRRQEADEEPKRREDREI